MNIVKYRQFDENTPHQVCRDSRGIAWHQRFYKIFIKIIPPSLPSFAFYQGSKFQESGFYNKSPVFPEFTSDKMMHFVTC